MDEISNLQEPVRKPQRKRMSRDEKARMTRESLLNAGCAVVAAEGYASASIAKIAGVAHGTFYNYFDDRQALFDELLPFEGKRMREAIEQAVRGSPSGFAKEVARFDAFLIYVIDNVGFYSILYEAEIFAPKAHRTHMENIVAGYKGTFERAMAEGWMRKIDMTMAECLIYQILGIRAYSAMQIHFAASLGEKSAIRSAAVNTYRFLLNGGLVAGQSEAG